MKLSNIQILDANKLEIYTPVVPNDIPTRKNAWAAGQRFKMGLQEDCLHKQCASCNGTGINTVTGAYCIHHISCLCPKCSPVY